MENHPWEREEILLLVDLYFEFQKQLPTREQAASSMNEISKLLRSRVIKLGYDISGSSRDYHAVAERMSNIQHLASNGEYGSRSAFDFDKEMVDKYAENPEFMHSQALIVRKKYESDIKTDEERRELSDDECPLVSELKKLKKSSSEAVDNEESFSDFKRYMHIYRSLEGDLIQKIEQAKQKNGKSLILVCGNVGDGKSHIISYLKNTKGSLLDGFIIHNDATESKSRNRNEKEELAKVLENFKDKNLENNSCDKIIVAINLGVLSNFIDSEQGRDFTKLAEYVDMNKILIDTDISNYSNGYFSHVNFGDYHIYRLIDGKVDSPYITEVIKKIFVNNADNNFYAKYEECGGCGVKDCPVKHNFEMMGQQKISDGVINILIETIIKDKIILSTRELLDFFYDIIVHPGFDKPGYSKCKNKLSKYMEYSMPGIMFSHDDISNLLAHIKKYDFITQRTKDFDDITTRFNTTDNVKELFTTYISDNPAMRYIISNDINEYCSDSTKSGKDFRKELLYYFARMCKIAPMEDSLSTLNHEFNEFIEYLYYSTKNDTKKLRSLYSTVQKCVYLWNGGSSDYINLKNDVEGYNVSAGLELKVFINPNLTVSANNSFEKFPAYISVTFMEKHSTANRATIAIDYDLYKILKSVENGYRPSAKDNNRFIGFLSFINRLSGFSSQSEEVVIECLKHDVMKKYKLKKDDLGYSFEEAD